MNNADILSLERLAAAANGEIRLEKRVYTLTRTWHLPSDIRLVGNGATLQMSPGTEGNLLAITDGSDVVLEDLTLRGYLGEALTASTSGIDRFLLRIQRSERIRLRDVRVLEHQYTAVHCSDVRELTVTDCTFSQLGLPTAYDRYPLYSYDGIFIGGYRRSGQILIEGCTFDRIGTHEVYTTNTVGDDGDGIHLQTPKSGVLSNVTVRNCIFNACSARGIKVQSGSHLQLNRNVFTNCRAGIELSMANPVSDISIRNNTFSKGYHAWGTNGADMIATGVTFADNRMSKLDHVYRSSGGSVLANSIIADNVAEELQRYFVDGIFRSCRIENNTVRQFGLAEDKSYYMAVMIADGSEGVVLDRNILHTRAKTATAIYIKPGTKNITLEDNDILLPAGKLSTAYGIYCPNRPSAEFLSKNTIKQAAPPN